MAKLLEVAGVPGLALDKFERSLALYADNTYATESYRPSLLRIETAIGERCACRDPADHALCVVHRVYAALNAQAEAVEAGAIEVLTDGDEFYTEAQHEEALEEAVEKAKTEAEEASKPTVEKLAEVEKRLAAAEAQLSAEQVAALDREQPLSNDVPDATARELRRSLMKELLETRSDLVPRDTHNEALATLNARVQDRDEQIKRLTAALKEERGEGPVGKKRRAPGKTKLTPESVRDVLDGLGVASAVQTEGPGRLPGFRLDNARVVRTESATWEVQRLVTDPRSPGREVQRVGEPATTVEQLRAALGAYMDEQWRNRKAPAPVEAPVEDDDEPLTSARKCPDCGARCRFDPDKVGFTCGGLQLRGWDWCDACDKGWVTRAGVPTDDAGWKLTGVGASIDAGGWRIRLEGEGNRKGRAALLQRLLQLPTLETEIEALRRAKGPAARQMRADAAESTVQTGEVIAAPTTGTAASSAPRFDDGAVTASPLDLRSPRAVAEALLLQPSGLQAMIEVCRAQRPAIFKGKK